MTVIRRAAFVPYSCAQMFDLVNDVGAYPEFLPWCTEGSVLSRREGHVRARLGVRKGRLAYAFTTDNRLDHDRAIELSLVDGPFRKLHGWWRFEPADGGCVIGLELEFEVAGRVLGGVLAHTFKSIADSLVEAFKNRAFAVYGR